MRPVDDDPEESPWADRADRRIAHRALDEHRHEGRLTADEHDRRHTLAHQARTHADLHALFADLPPPHPMIGEPPVLVPRPTSIGTGTILLTAAPVILGAVAAGWWGPALLFAIVLAVVLTIKRTR